MLRNYYSWGFETPAEAMYLNKKLLSIPILNHFEQECNAEAMKKLGIKVLKKLTITLGIISPIGLIKIIR